MKDLIERLEKAEGADRKMDQALQEKLIGAVVPVPHYTNSIDAALGLVERVLPGWACSFDKTPQWTVALVSRLEGDGTIRIRSDGQHKSPAIAILIALLKAVEGE